MVPSSLPAHNCLGHQEKRNLLRWGNVLGLYARQDNAEVPGFLKCHILSLHVACFSTISIPSREGHGANHILS